MKDKKSVIEKAVSNLKELKDVTMLKEVVKEIEQQIAALEQFGNNDSNDTVSMLKVATGHYALELVKCGKRSCKCYSGKKEDLHGPYWYHYRYIGGGKFAPRYKKNLSRQRISFSATEGLANTVKCLSCLIMFYETIAS